MAIFRKSNLTMSDHETWSNWHFNAQHDNE